MCVYAGARVCVCVCVCKSVHDVTLLAPTMSVLCISNPTDISSYRQICSNSQSYQSKLIPLSLCTVSISFPVPLGGPLSFIFFSITSAISSMSALYIIPGSGSTGKPTVLDEDEDPLGPGSLRKATGFFC